MPIKRTRLALADICCLVAGIVLATTIAGAHFARAEAPPTQALDAGQVISQLADTLTAGRRDTIGNLNRLGLQPEVQRMTTVDGATLHTFSSRSMIESLYRRAELHTKGEGQRFLAVLYNDVSKVSVAMANDPTFAGLRQYSADELKRPIRFADPTTIRNSAARAPLPEIIENAVSKLAEFYSGRNLAQARGLLGRILQKPGFSTRNIDAAIADEKTTRDVLRRLLTEGTPPPRIDLALREVMRQAMAQSAALRFDATTLTIMDELSKDLPPELERYIQSEEDFESRKRQASESARISRPGKDAPIPAHNDIIARIDAAIAQAGKPTSSPGSRPTAGPLSDPPAAPGAVAEDPNYPKGSGGGGATQARAQSTASAEAYEKYTRSTFEPRPGSPSTRSPGTSSTPTPRTYRVAIRSASAARGIAIGGKVSSEVRSKPVRAAWVANLKDDRFGRIFVELVGEDGKPAVAVSRVLFADSFYAASDALSTTRGEEARFRDGEILVLMSMDPDAQITKNAVARLQADAKDLRQRAIKEAEAAQRQLRAEYEGLLNRVRNATTRAEQLRLGAEVDALKQRADNQQQELKAKVASWAQQLKLREALVPRGVVVHPSIYGRELAWSATRVDFWFNQIQALDREASMINGGRAMPDQLKNISFEGATTWQFFQRDAVIRLGPSVGNTRPLVVASNGSRDHVRSHFGISMFGAEPALERLPKLETQVEALLDWLAVNHHDFMRLNDFSEAFSLLRWIGSSRTPMTVIDMDGQGAALASPDHVVIGIGPGTPR